MLPTLIISSICISCDSCAIVCPDHAIVTNGRVYIVDTFSCTLCQLCVEVCPVDCIKLISQGN